jgi:hypothetical protein
VGSAYAVAALPLEAFCLDDTGHLLSFSPGLVQRENRVAMRQTPEATGDVTVSLGMGAFGEQSSLHPLDLGLPQRASLP